MRGFKRLRRPPVDWRPRVPISIPLPGDLDAQLVVRVPMSDAAYTKLKTWIEFYQEALTTEMDTEMEDHTTDGA